MYVPLIRFVKYLPRHISRIILGRR
jgi:hypothetical protein